MLITIGQINDEKKFDLGITIDNLPPNGVFQELAMEDNNSNGTIVTTEPIRVIDGWNFSNNNTYLSKIFSSPIYYPLPITDYAQNSSEVFISIKKASNIMLYYHNYNGYPVDSFQSGGQISGKQAILDNSIKKTESLFIDFNGSLPDSFLQGKAYDYNYWGEGSTGLCTYTESRYTYGYNPISSWRYLGSDIHGSCNFYGHFCFKFGGIGQNVAGKENISGPIKTAIPENISKQYLFGLSSVTFKLTDYSNYSIIYQIYVNKVGWLPTASDGQETFYSLDKPFSAIRMGLVPKSEKQYVINFWNRNIGTNNVN